MLVPLRDHLERYVKTLVAKQDPREPARVPKLARRAQIKIKFKKLKKRVPYRTNRVRLLLDEWLVAARV